MNHLEELIEQSKPDANGESRQMTPAGHPHMTLWMAQMKGHDLCTLFVNTKGMSAMISMTGPELIALGAALIAHGRELLPEVPNGFATEGHPDYNKKA